MLKHLPFLQPRIGYCRYVEVDGKKKAIQKKVDVLLAVDLTQMSLQKSITDAVIVAGDGDFVPALKVAKTAGTCIHLVHAKICSTDLVRHADVTYMLDKKTILSWEKTSSGRSPQSVVNKKIIDAKRGKKALKEMK